MTHTHTQTPFQLIHSAHPTMGRVKKFKGSPESPSPNEFGRANTLNSKIACRNTDYLRSKGVLWICFSGTFFARSTRSWTWDQTYCYWSWTSGWICQSWTSCHSPIIPLLQLWTGGALCQRMPIWKTENHLLQLRRRRALCQRLWQVNIEQSVILLPWKSKGMFKLNGCRPYQGYHWQSEISLLCCQDIVQPLILNYTISEKKKSKKKSYPTFDNLKAFRLNSPNLELQFSPLVMIHLDQIPQSQLGERLGCCCVAWSL